MRAKKKLTKLWSILLTLVMVVGLLPTVALAEGSTPTPATTTADFTSGDGSAALKLLNAAKTQGAKDSTWDAGTKTLTLNGINFTTTAAIAVKLPHDSKIVLPDGTTNIIKSENSNNSTQSCGIYLEEAVSGNIGDLTIKIPDGSDGTGKLTVTGGAAREYSQGIRSGSGKVTISGGIVEATGGTAESSSEGILAQNGLAISGNAKVTAIGGSGSNNSYGIYGSSNTSKVEISDNADVTAISAAAFYDSYGIYIYSAVNITGGTVKCSAGAASNSYGIYGNRAVNITGGTVKCSAGAASRSSRSYGIYSIKNVNIDRAEVIAAGKSAAINIYEGSLTTSNVKNISFDANGGSGNMIAYTNADSYTLPANGFTAPADKQFKGWKVGDEIKAVGDSIDVSGSIPTVYAQWGDAEYAVTVTNGTASPSGAQVAGTSVAITANDAPVGKQFKEWTGADGLTFTSGSKTSATATFTMPNRAVTLIATYEDKTYAVGVTYGTASPSGAQVAGTSVTITANDAPVGKQFKEWTGADGLTFTSGSKTSATATFTMPNRAVTLIATYEDKTYAVGVTYGTASPSGAQVAGTSVTITANDAPVGKQFKEWTGADGLTFTSGSKTSATATFTMPNRAVTLIATYENIPVATYTVTFEANGGSVTPTTATTAADGKLTSLPTPTRSGYTFNGWYTAESGGTKVDTAYVFGTDTTIYAQWTSIPIPTPTPIYTPPTYKVESAVSKDADGSVSFSQNSAKKGDAVTITVTPDRYYKVDGVTVKDASGKEIAVTDNGDGTFTFQMPDSKVTVEPAFSWDNPFVDVDENDYFAPAVEWALKNGITDGTGDGTTFSPNAPCTRAQAVTFLWRAAGCPEPESSVNPFTDVEEDAYYAKAVLWAVENGITDGTSATAFSPDETCSRGQIVTFLWRAEKSPAAGAANPFTDVETDAYYAGATNWAVENGITEGTGDGTTFSPANDCDRAQIVTFLYRYFVK